MNDDDDLNELEALVHEVAGMRIPLLLIGTAGFGLVLLFMVVLALLGGVVSLVPMMIPVFFVALPLLLFTASGAAAMGARVEPAKTVLAVNLQLAGWVLLLLQALGLFGLGALGMLAAMFLIF